MQAPGPGPALAPDQLTPQLAPFQAAAPSFLPAPAPLPSVAPAVAPLAAGPVSRAQAPAVAARHAPARTPRLAPAPLPSPVQARAPAAGRPCPQALVCVRVWVYEADDLVLGFYCPSWPGRSPCAQNPAKLQHLLGMLVRARHSSTCLACIWPCAELPHCLSLPLLEQAGGLSLEPGHRALHNGFKLHVLVEQHVHDAILAAVQAPAPVAAPAPAPTPQRAPNPPPAVPSPPPPATTSFKVPSDTAPPPPVSALCTQALTPRGKSIAGCAQNALR